MKKRYNNRNKFDVEKNIKETFSQKNLMLYLEVIGVALYSVGLATFANMKGWLAYAVSYGVPFVAGAVLNRPAMFITALAGASLHATFYGGDKLMAKSGKNTWGIQSPGMNGLSNDTSAKQLPPGVQMVNLDGRIVAVEPKSNLTMNDYIRENEEISFVNDWIGENEEIGYSNQAYINDWIGENDNIDFNTNYAINSNF